MAPEIHASLTVPAVAAGSLALLAATAAGDQPWKAAGALVLAGLAAGAVLANLSGSALPAGWGLTSVVVGVTVLSVGMMAVGGRALVGDRSMGRRAVTVLWGGAWFSSALYALAWAIVLWSDPTPGAQRVLAGVGAAVFGALLLLVFDPLARRGERSSGTPAGIFLIVLNLTLALSFLLGPG
jgi:hypothetical protein